MILTRAQIIVGLLWGAIVTAAYATQPAPYSPPDLSGYARSSNVPSMAPVQSVNGAQGAVTIPTVQRQISGAIDASSGSVTWIFPVAFANNPTCWPSLAATNTNFNYDYPVTSSISKTTVTMKVTAHPISLSIASLALPIVLSLNTNPPAGTTVVMSCVGALP